MLYSKYPCISGVRTQKRGYTTPKYLCENKIYKNRKNNSRMQITTCVCEGNKAVPALRMYKNRVK